MKEKKIHSKGRKYNKLVAEISYCAAFIRESASDCSIAMARRVLTIVEPVPGTKEVDANMVELLPAMERTRETMLGNERTYAGGLQKW